MEKDGHIVSIKVVNLVVDLLIQELENGFLRKQYYHGKRMTGLLMNTIYE